MRREAVEPALQAVGFAGASGFSRSASPTQTETDARRAVRKLVDHGSALLERAGDLIIAAIESSGADADMREFAASGAEATAANLLTVAKALEHNGLLRPGLDAAGAAAIRYTLGSPHVHHLLRRDQGWDVDRYRDWLVDTLTRTVLAEAPS